jgi:hypothetical protein
MIYVILYIWCIYIYVIYIWYTYYIYIYLWYIYNIIYIYILYRWREDQSFQEFIFLGFTYVTSHTVSIHNFCFWRGPHAVFMVQKKSQIWNLPTYNIWLVVHLYPSENYESQLGLFFSIYLILVTGKDYPNICNVINFMFQTTNQTWYEIRFVDCKPRIE